MKKLTREEKDKMPLRGRGHSTKFFRAILNMEPGEIFMIEAEEWKRKYPPTRLARYIEKKYPRKYETLKHAGGAGWVFERMK